MMTIDEMKKENEYVNSSFMIKAAEKKKRSWINYAL
jgi:hypothetical protein